MPYQRGHPGLLLTTRYYWGGEGGTLTLTLIRRNVTQGRTPRPPRSPHLLKDWATFSSGPLANQNFSLAPCASKHSAPQHPLKGGTGGGGGRLMRPCDRPVCAPPPPQRCFTRWGAGGLKVEKIVGETMRLGPWCCRQRGPGPMGAERRACAPTAHAGTAPRRLQTASDVAAENANSCRIFPPSWRVV